MNENYMKLRFLLDPEDWHGASAELLWIEPLWGGTMKVFRLMNSPFYARGVSYLDIVRAVPAPDGYGIDYAGIVEKSGHSTIWLLVPSGPPAGFNSCWLSLARLHCTYESSSEDTEDGKQTLYSVDVPPETDIDAVLSIVEDGQANDVWIFQIGDLARKRATAPETRGRVN
jgi:Domain of unknown function (DUF4265)